MDEFLLLHVIFHEEQTYIFHSPSQSNHMAYPLNLLHYLVQKHHFLTFFPSFLNKLMLFQNSIFLWPFFHLHHKSRVHTCVIWTGHFVKSIRLCCLDLHPNVVDSQTCTYLSIQENHEIFVTSNHFEYCMASYPLLFQASAILICVFYEFLKNFHCYMVHCTCTMHRRNVTFLIHIRFKWSNCHFL